MWFLELMLGEVVQMGGGRGEVILRDMEVELGVVGMGILGDIMEQILEVMEEEEEECESFYVRWDRMAWDESRISLRSVRYSLRTGCMIGV